MCEVTPPGRAPPGQGHQGPFPHGSQPLPGLSGSHLSCGMGMAGQAGEVRVTLGETRRGRWMAEGPRGFDWIIRNPQAESQGWLG